MLLRCSLLLLIVSSWLASYSQSDTLRIYTYKFKSITEKNLWNFGLKSDSILLEKHGHLFDQIDDSLTREIGKGYYCIFFDLKGRKIEEVFWDHENFNGNYVSYYKSGTIKTKGEFSGSKEIGKWIYYGKNGLIKRVKSF